MRVDHVELMAAKQRPELLFEVPADREIDERTIERNQQIAADTLDRKIRRTLAAKVTRDDRDIVSATHELLRRMVHVLGHATEARVVRLGDDADLHDAAR